MQKRLELAFKIIVGLTFFVPLIFLPKDFIFPFIVPKIIIFRILTLLLLGIYLILLAMDWKRYAVSVSFLTIGAVLFLLSFGLSTFFGMDWYRSLWDNHERMLGLFTVTHYVVYYFIVTSVVRGWQDWRWLLRTFLLAGGIVMGIAFIQQFDNEFLLNTSGNRSAATLGNAIYVGGYGIFLTFIGWLLVVKEKNNFWKWFAGLTGFLGFLGIFFSGTRGAFLGLAAGFIALFIFYFITLKENKKIRIILGSIILAGVAFFGILYLFRSNRVVANLPLVGRVLSISLSGFSNTTRGMAWGIAVQGWQEKPILGWGPGNYYYAFNKYYRPEFLQFGYRETWFDAAHNIVLNNFTERGVIGGVIYLALFLGTIFVLLNGYRKKSFDPHTMNIGSAFLVAHLVQTFTVFENPTSYLYFFFFLAFINSQVVYSAEAPRSPASFGQNRLPMATVAAVSLTILLLIYSANINPARANMATFEVLKRVYKLEDPRDAYKLATSFSSPHIDDIRNDVARAISGSLRGYVQAGKAEVARSLFQLAYGEIGKNRQLHPLDVRVHSQQIMLAQEAALLSGDKTLLLEAEKVAEDALVKSPKRQQFLYTAAGIKIQLNKIDEAEALYKQAIADNEKISESWWRLALLYSVSDRMDKAVQLIKSAQAKNISFDADGQGVINEILNRATSSTAVK